jgi:hypothetical protein
MYNVTLRGVRVTTVAVENQYYILVFWWRVFSLNYPECKARASHCHLRPLPISTINLSTLSHTLYDFRKKKKLFNTKCVL